MRQPVAELVRQGLSAAALASSDTAGGGKKSVTFFPSNQAGRAAAAFALENALLDCNPPGDFSQPFLTETGWNWLRGQGVQVLNDFLRQVEQWKDQDRVLIAKIRENSARLERLEVALKAMLGGVGQNLPPSEVSVEILKLAIVEGLAASFEEDAKSVETSCDISLPDLFKKIRQKIRQDFSLGAFQDALRGLHVEGKILFHPWTGTLYSIPDPGFALLVGHEVAYYVSLKKP